MSTTHFKTIFILLLLLTVSCNPKQFSRNENQQDNDTVNDFETLTAIFKNPPADYSTVPYWVWNDEITKEKIDIQLMEFKNQSINSLIIHCRPGLITEYLTDEWFELNDYALEKAKSLGVQVWLYDENAFPSGFGGGHVLREMPESHNQPQGLKMVKSTQLKPADLAEAMVVLQRRNNVITDITGDAEKHLGKTGEYYVFIKTYGRAIGRWTGYPYPDLLVPGVTEKFIEITMQGYEKTFGDEFGKNIIGIFTDEPHIKSPANSDIRWTPDLFKKFEERWGYRLQENLAALFEDLGDYKKVRHNYYQLLIELFVERWSKPWYDYTEANNLNWTGHYWEHGWPNPSHASDHMILYAYHQVPGIDMLFNDREARPDQFGNIMAARELLSIANQFGRHRTLSETYGASGWDLDFEAMKILGDWQYAGGVNLMNQHLAYMTTKGARKRDFPQSISWHASWWPHYHHLASHYARLSLALSSGQNLNNILVIIPTTTTWMYFTPEHDKGYLGAAGITKSYGNDFKEFLQLLEKDKIEYDLGSEMVIQEFATEAEGQFVIKNRKYEKVVLGPHVENLNRKTVELISAFLSNGGTLYYHQELPHLVEAEPSDEILKLTEKYPALVKKIDESPENLKKSFANTSFELLSASHPDDLVHQRRILEDGQLVFMTNFSKTDINEVSYQASGRSVSRLNSLTGESTSFPYQKEGSNLAVSFHLHPGESKLLFFHNRKTNSEETPEEQIQYNKELPGSDMQITRNNENVLVLGYCELDVAGRHFENINYLHATDSIFKFHGFQVSDIDHNPWNFAVQYKSETLDRNEDFPSDSGFEATFPFQIGNNYDLKPIKIAIEYGHLYTVRLNGEIIEEDKSLDYFDHSIDVYPVKSEMLRKGKNEIQLSIRPMHVHAELERIFILGDFDVAPDSGGFEIQNSFPLKKGNWVEQGLPFYPESVSYIKKFTFGKDKQPAKIVLDEWQGAVAAVKVNGKEAGIIGWQPYELIVDDFIKAGDNEIEVVIYGTPRNLLGPHYNNPPKGIATPWSWNNAPANQPAGSEYSFVTYGLLNDYKIFTN
jgi:hypothetical protein